jgi:hypothetical protein
MTTTAPITKNERCAVCDRPIPNGREIVEELDVRGYWGRGAMCDPCGKAYSKLCRQDSTTIGLIRWVARRARATLKRTS